jgi:HlyD family secretion protein
MPRPVSPRIEAIMTDQAKALTDLLGETAHRRPWYRRPGPLVAIALLALALAWLAWPRDRGRHEGDYVTATAAYGDLTVTASASGTLQPLKSVEVGSELSGTLETVLVEENDRVKTGQILATLDTAKLKDAVVKSQAALAAAEASVAQAQATVAEAQASLSRMRQVAELSGGKVPAKTELETAEATLRRAVANEASARASVSQARAALQTDQTNLTKATIRAPIDGVVLTRKVEPGNTIVAAMTTPVLFVLAEDLTRMELQVKVDEADVATVMPGQEASFTVSAWPARAFPATIRRVGLGSSTTDNVVTYKTILDVANDDLALRPGMTATAKIVTARRSHALLVPNAALRFTPPAEPAGSGGGVLGALLPAPPGPQKSAARSGGSSEPQLWVLQGGALAPVKVRTGVSDGRFTEILGDALAPGAAVVTDYRKAAK